MPKGTRRARSTTGRFVKKGSKRAKSAKRTVRRARSRKG